MKGIHSEIFRLVKAGVCEGGGGGGCGCDKWWGGLRGGREEKEERARVRERAKGYRRGADGNMLLAVTIIKFNYACVPLIKQKLDKRRS
jgi:hypothetical protein